jgi:Pentapeptide repeats (9 copies)
MQLVNQHGQVIIEDSIRKTDKDPNVEKIRTFFDNETKHLRSDKLSQAYISANFTEQDAMIYQLSLYDLRLLFHAYCQESVFSPNLGFPKQWWQLKESTKQEEWKAWFKNRLRNIIPQYASKLLCDASKLCAGIVLIFGFGKFVVNLEGIERQKYFQAWQVINSANGQTGSGGRKEALEYLNKESSFWFTPDCKHENNCLVGIRVVGPDTKNGANLNGIKLQNANLKSSDFTAASFEGAQLQNTKFIESKLKFVSFRKADLTDVSFEKADLVVDLNSKKFEGTIFCRTIMPSGSRRDDRCPSNK